MATSKRCIDCDFWKESFSRQGDKFGVCDHPIVEGIVIIDREQDVTEESVIHTESRFGCIYHTPVHGNVVTKLEES